MSGWGLPKASQVALNVSPIFVEYRRCDIFVSWVNTGGATSAFSLLFKPLGSRPGSEISFDIESNW